MPDSTHFQPVPLAKAYRLLNHGPTVLVSSAHQGVVNVMAAAWSCPLDFEPPKVTVVIDKSTRTRELVEASGQFVLNVPSKALSAQVVGVGTDSAKDVPNKLEKHQLRTFLQSGDVPLVDGCVGWLICKVIPEPHIQATYDLFIGEVVAAFSDARVFSDGHWHFDGQPDHLRTLHYVAGGQFYAAGESVVVEK